MDLSRLESVANSWGIFRGCETGNCVFVVVFGFEQIMGLIG